MMLSHGLRDALAAAGSDRIVYDLTGIVERCDELVRQLPGAGVRFAVKACPVDAVLAALAAAGAGCDAASPQEIVQALRAAVPVERVHYGNTVKSDAAIAEAFRLGVRDFATDSAQDVAAIAAHAPGSRVFCRIAATGEGALWRLTRKFGCSPAGAASVLEAARDLGLEPDGLSVHVGSQQMRPAAWRAAFEDLAEAIGLLRTRGIRPRRINLGGGLPSLGNLDRRGAPLDPPLDKIFATIREGMRRLSQIAGGPLDFIVEPGRHLVADHGAIRAHVHRLTARELIDGQRQNWLYLSVGKFNGLYEMDELRYRLIFPEHRTDGPCVLAAIAGPTCDSDDAFSLDGGPVPVPAALRSGDPVWIVSCGAYAVSYTTESFNGFDPLPLQTVRGPRVRPIAARDWDVIARLEHAAYADLGLSEGRERLLSRAAVSPQTCFALEVEEKAAGYLLALPQPAGQFPDLHRSQDSAEAARTRAASDVLHLHDLVIAPEARGRGLSRLLLRRLEARASAGAVRRISLVAVGGSARFWAAAGFVPHPEVKVPGYGPGAVYMSKPVEADPLAACPR